MAIILNRTVPLDAPISVESLHGVVFSNENKGHKFVITGIRGGELQTFTGSVIARFIRANNTTILMGEGAEGELAACAEIEDGKVAVSLARDCYNVPGRFQLTVFVTSDGETSCIYAAVGTVQRSENGTLIDDGVVLPSVDELQSMLDEIQQYETNIATAGAAQIAAVQAKGEETLDSIPDDYTALQGEVDDLKSAITFFGGGTAITLNWHYGYIRASDLTIVNSGSTHVYSDVIIVPAGNMLYLPRVNKSTSVVLLALCNSDGTPQQILLPGVSTSYSTHEHILYPFFDDTYVRIGGNMSEADYMSYYIKPITDDYIFDENNFALFNSPKVLNYTNNSAITTAGQGTFTGMSMSDKICLPKGMTLEYWGCGAGVDNVYTVTDYPPTGSAGATSAVDGTSIIQHAEYTAPKHMYVRLCARIAPTEGADYLDILPEVNFKAWRIYYKPTHYSDEIKNSFLYGKHLTVMGDSLVHGNQLGPDATWINAVGLKYNMTVTNLGISGTPIAGTDSTAMVNRLSAIPSDTDIFILEGGANDKNNNVPIGDIESYDTTTFCGALNTIIDYVRQNLPRARFGLLTNWQRYVTLTDSGYNEESYVNAMVAVAHNKSVPVFDNYHGCGLTFYNADLAAWIDEGKDRQRLTNGVVQYYNNGRSVHFSVAAYEWLMPLYEQFLLNMRASGDSALRQQLAALENFYVQSCADRYTTFESGTITSTGIESTNSAYIRSGYIPIDDFIRMDKPTGIKVYPCIYKVENGETVFIKRMPIFDSGYSTTVSRSTVEIYDPTTKYIRFVATNGALDSGLNIWIPGSRA